VKVQDIQSAMRREAAQNGRAVTITRDDYDRLRRAGWAVEASALHFAGSRL
jgi:hypothetical protein